MMSLGRGRSGGGLVPIGRLEITMNREVHHGAENDNARIAQEAVNLLHRSNRISYMLQRVCEDECSDLTGSEEQRVDVLDPIHAKPRLHIASDVSFTRKIGRRSAIAS